VVGTTIFVFLYVLGGFSFHGGKTLVKTGEVYPVFSSWDGEYSCRRFPLVVFVIFSTLSTGAKYSEWTAEKSVKLDRR